MRLCLQKIPRNASVTGTNATVATNLCLISKLLALTSEYAHFVETICALRLKSKPDVVNGIRSSDPGVLINKSTMKEWRASGRESIYSTGVRHTSVTLQKKQNECVAVTDNLILSVQFYPAGYLLKISKHAQSFVAVAKEGRWFHYSLAFLGESSGEGKTTIKQFVKARPVASLAAAVYTVRNTTILLPHLFTAHSQVALWLPNTEVKPNLFVQDWSSQHHACLFDLC